MTYEYRRPIFNLSGTLSVGCSALDTALQSTVFPNLPSDYSTALYLPLVIADDTQGKSEIVWVNSHAAAASSVGVIRGREGTSAQAFSAGSVVRCSPTLRDVVSAVANRAALPADAHYGCRVLILDEAQVVERTSAGWNDSAPLEGDTTRRHHWQQTGAPATSPPQAGQILAGVTGNQVGTAGTLATMSAGNLTLLKAGLWAVKVAGFGLATSGTTFGVGMKWTNGAFLTVPFSVAGVGTSASLMETTWIGYATAAHIANAIGTYMFSNGTINAGAQYDVTAEYLGA